MDCSSTKLIEFSQNKQENPNFLLVYCNGILSNYAEETFQRSRLQEQVGIISSCFGNRKVTVFNNPTSLEEYLCLNQDNQKRVEKEKKIANEFADYIRMKVEELSSDDSSMPCIIIVAHSHGAWITNIALKLLNPKERKHLNVYTFGGVAMIPKNLASVVENYVFKDDMISRGGNKRYDPEGILDRVLKITQRSQADNTSLEAASSCQFLEEWFAELDPSSESLDPKDNNERKNKLQTYFSTFWSNDSESIKGLEERYEKYVACLKDYHITVLSRPIEKPNEIFKGEFSNLIKFMKQKTASYGTEIDDNCHKIVAYKKVIGEIAQKVLQKIEFNKAEGKARIPKHSITENDDYEEYRKYFEKNYIDEDGFPMYSGLGMTYQYWKEKIKRN